MIERVREIVRKECTESDWNHHIILVVKHAKLLAKKLGADVEIAEVGALLHDIGRIKFGSENHEATGVPEAEKILRGLNYPEEVISEIRHCIESHRGSGTMKPRTAIARIVANADAMAHFDAVPVLMQAGMKRENGNLEKACEWVYEKIERDWNKKLTIPEARQMMEEKYKAIRLVFGSMREHSE